jgi:hypothetical protein
MEIGWPSIAASASLPPTPPAHDPQLGDHCGVQVEADQGIRVCHRHSILFPGNYHFSQVFQVDLLHEADLGWHSAIIIEGPLPPAQEGKAFPVTFEGALGIVTQGIG